jgi:NADPH:quinone reductase
LWIEADEGGRYVRNGLYPAPEYPVVLGCEGAGIIDSVGEGVTSFKRGDRVAYMADKVPLPAIPPFLPFSIVLTRKTYAGYTIVPTKFTIKIPDTVPMDVAGGSIVGGLTVLTLVQEAYSVRKGDWILVHAAAGGTGQLLGQVLKQLGAHAIGTVSTKEKGALARKLGYEYVIESYDHDVVLNKVMELTDGKGVICVYDGVRMLTSNPLFPRAPVSKMYVDGFWR